MRKLSVLIKKICSRKTLVVLLKEKIFKKFYKKFFIRKNKISVHYENSFLKKGDFVIIKQSSPFSKKKSWIFYKKLNI